MRLFWCYVFQFMGLGFATWGGISRNKKVILFTIFCANISSLCVMLLAGRYDGAAAVIVCAVRAFLFLFRDRVKTGLICWGCVAAHIAVGLLAWQSPLSLLVVLAPVVLSVTNWYGSVDVVKYGTMFSDACWMIFDVSNGIYVEALRDLAEIVSNLVGLARGRKKTEGKEAKDKDE